MATPKSKAIDTKALQSSVNDFIKLYNLELSDSDAVEGKQNVEKFLKEKIQKELDNYEH
jgi:hypothetical protein